MHANRYYYGELVNKRTISISFELISVGFFLLVHSNGKNAIRSHLWLCSIGSANRRYLC